MSLLPMFLQDGMAASTTPNLLSTVVPFLLIFVIFYFFIIRPQSKKQKEMEKMLKALKKGDKVVTIGGIHGTVDSVKEKTVVVRVAENVRMEFNRSAVASVLNPKKAEDQKKPEKAEQAEEASSENI